MRNREQGRQKGSKEAGKAEQKGRFLQGEDRSAGRQSKASMAEFENFRKRTDKEKQAMFDTGARV